VVFALSPYAIRYATETRMYALVMFLVAWGYLVLVKALEAPRLGWCATVAVLTAALLYTHNWSWWLVATVGVFVLGVGWRAREPIRRRAALWVVVAMVAGGIAYLPWFDTVREQLAKTGTPWGDRLVPWTGVTGVFDGLGGLADPARGGRQDLAHGEALVL